MDVCGASLDVRTESSSCIISQLKTNIITPKGFKPARPRRPFEHHHPPGFQTCATTTTTSTTMGAKAHCNAAGAMVCPPVTPEGGACIFDNEEMGTCEVNSGDPPECAGQLTYVAGRG